MPVESASGSFNVADCPRPDTSIRLTLAMTISNRLAAWCRPRRSAGVLACAVIAIALVSACLDSPRPGKSESPAISGNQLTSQPTTSTSVQGTRHVSRMVGGPHDFSDGRGDARSLCLTCHTPEGMTDGAARPPAERLPRSRAVLAQDSDRELDRHSLVCLGCHDGVIATDVFTTAHAASLASLGPSGDRSPALAGHPIGGRYPSDHPRYRAASIATRDGRIRLPGGRVQCVSCHDPHDAGSHPAMLVKSNERSALCLSCHRL
ncbi:Doubled CXXCH motif (Paired_CXXCH_1) [Phycisphaerae bacterium RAS2]|nr:Doubled CXXCH motif (Paired_CXXCH_1) [Phycisphaerae bacterium RAS2]